MYEKIRLLTFGALQNAENLSHKVREIDAFLYFLESEIARCLQRPFEIEGGMPRSSPWRVSEVERGSCESEFSESQHYNALN